MYLVCLGQLLLKDRAGLIDETGNFLRIHRGAVASNVHLICECIELELV